MSVDNKTKALVRFQRPNYVVRDLDKALTVYSGILGLDIAFTKDSEKDSYSYEVFQIDSSADMRFAVLSAEGQPRVMALTELTNIDLTEMTYPSRSAVVFECEDFDGVMTAAKEAGLKVFEESRLETQDGRIGREIGFHDYDGNLIVIYTILEQGVG